MINWNLNLPQHEAIGRKFAGMGKRNFSLTAASGEESGAGDIIVIGDQSRGPGSPATTPHCILDFTPQEAVDVKTN